MLKIDIKNIKTFDEYKKINWMLIDRICDAEYPRNSKEYNEIINAIKEMKRLYPKFFNDYANWVNKNTQDI